MATFSQALRHFRVTSPLGEDALLVERFSVVERVSSLFTMSLDLQSPLLAIDPKKILRKGLTLTVDTGIAETRHFHGIVRSFTHSGQRDEMGIYHAEVVPYAWLLSLARDSRIFQDKSALEIVKKVFAEQGLKDVDYSGVTKEPPKRAYCVQYRETHLDFVSRLLEEEGIFFFFQQTESKHTMVLADNPGAVKVSGVKAIRMAHVGENDREESVSQLEVHDVVGLKTLLLADYNMETPSQQLWYPEPKAAAEVKSGDDLSADFDYPAKHGALDEAERQSKLRAQELESMLRSIRGRSNYTNLRAGAKVELAENDRKDLNQPYHITSVAHAGSMQLGTRDAGASEYSNEFVAIPHAVPYRPARVTPKPIVTGAQTAIVVGPAGNEIHVDKFGRVKVKFHWDPAKTGNEKSSCYIRVATPWAGKGWGVIHIPRIGQEVVVDFLEGDPDRPLIVGSVYNAENMPPYALPANHTQSGIKSRSSPKGAADNFNEFRFEDNKGKEEIYLHAEKDLVIVVENDERETIHHDNTILVKNDRKKTVEGNETTAVVKDRTETVSGNETISIAKNRTEKVDGNETITVTKDRTEKVDGNESITITKDRTQKVSGTETITITGHRTETLDAKHTLNVASDIMIKGSTKITIKAESEIKLECSGNTITIGPSGIEIKAAAKVSLDGAMVEVKGSGPVQIQGAIVKIN